jgi:hypothetical protein
MTTATGKARKRVSKNEAKKRIQNPAYLTSLIIYITYTW